MRFGLSPYFSHVEIAKAYLRYRRKAKTRHGIHSPFVYELVEKVFRERNWLKSTDIKKLRKELLQSNEELEINDLGAGSRVDNHTRRQVSRILKVSSTSLKDAGMLQRLADYMNCENILELGTNLGLTTAALAAAESTRKIISIEGDAGLARLAQKNLEKLGLEAEIITGAFEEKLELVLMKFDCIDMAYLDGNHRKAPTLTYFNAILNKTHQNSVIVVGDIHWSKDMEEAWENIKSHPEVCVTIDIFDMGLVFFRKEMTNEHFIIKY